MLLQSKFYPTLLYIVFVFFIAFLFAFFISSAFIQNKNKTKKKKKEGSNQLPVVIYRQPPFMWWGHPVCIGDNAYFCSGGGHTLVGTKYAHVTCSVYGKKF